MSGKLPNGDYIGGVRNGVLVRALTTIPNRKGKEDFLRAGEVTAIDRKRALVLKKIGKAEILETDCIGLAKPKQGCKDFQR